MAHEQGTWARHQILSFCEVHTASPPSVSNQLIQTSFYGVFFVNDNTDARIRQCNFCFWNTSYESTSPGWPITKSSVVGLLQYTINCALTGAVCLYCSKSIINCFYHNIWIFFFFTSTFMDIQICNNQGIWDSCYENTLNTLCENQQSVFEVLQINYHLCQSF